MPASSARARIRTLNDALRRDPGQGRLALTAGVAALSPEQQRDILRAVAGFDAFDPGNDPSGEHDFGAFRVGDARLFFKIDPYDRDLRQHSPDPANPAVTTRVLTIMLAEEY